MKNITDRDIQAAAEDLETLVPKNLLKDVFAERLLEDMGVLKEDVESFEMRCAFLEARALLNDILSVCPTGDEDDGLLEDIEVAQQAGRDLFEIVKKLTKS